MGREATCRLRAGRTTSEVRALLETNEILIRGDAHMRIPFADIRSLRVERGWLRIGLDGGDVALGLGDEAAKWLASIRKPKGRLEKLGVQPGMKVAVISVGNKAFSDELKAHGAVAVREISGAGVDLVFLGAARKPDLERLSALATAIAPAGAIWVLWPKGRAELREDDVRAAAKRCGLVDVKVVAFSLDLSGLKLVIPLASRPPAKRGR